MFRWAFHNINYMIVIPPGKIFYTKKYQYGGHYILALGLEYFPGVILNIYQVDTKGCHIQYSLLEYSYLLLLISVTLISLISSKLYNIPIFANKCCTFYVVWHVQNIHYWIDIFCSEIIPLGNWYFPMQVNGHRVHISMGKSKSNSQTQSTSSHLNAFSIWSKMW